jgi:hypothetical protein
LYNEWADVLYSILHSKSYKLLKGNDKNYVLHNSNVNNNVNDSNDINNSNGISNNIKNSINNNNADPSLKWKVCNVLSYNCNNVGYWIKKVNAIKHLHVKNI